MRRERRHTGLMVGLIATTLAFLTVIQVRSQDLVSRSLENQDNTSLAFLIDDLHVANDQLAVQASTLDERRTELARNQNSPVAPLEDEAQRLRIIEGIAPAAGPGVKLVVQAPLTALDLQDAANNLRAGGAEALSINGERIVDGTVIAQSGSDVTVDGISVRGPWTFVAIGNPGSLQPETDAMASSLRADPRVRSVSYLALGSLEILGVVTQRPLVYGTS